MLLGKLREDAQALIGERDLVVTVSQVAAAEAADASIEHV
jgi:hypothetical protein